MAANPSSEDLAQLFRTSKEDLKHEFYVLYIANENEVDNNNNHHHNHRLMEIRNDLYFRCRSHKNSTALVEKGVLSQADVDDAWMVLFYTQLLQLQTATAAVTGHDQCCCTWESMNESVRNALSWAVPPNDDDGSSGSNNSNSLALELLLDSDAVQAELNRNDGHGLLDAPQKKVRFDTGTGRQEVYIAGGLFDLQSCIKAMRREESTSTTGGGATSRPKKRRRRRRLSGWDDNHEEYAQLSLAFILVSIIYDVWIAQRQQDHNLPLTIDSFLQMVRGFQRYSPVLDNALLSSNAPFWFLFDLFMRSSSSNPDDASESSLIIPVDLDLAYIQGQLCGFGSGAVPILAEATGCCVSEEALKARCAEQIMSLLGDVYYTKDQQPSSEHQAILQACAAIKGQLFLGWSSYLEGVTRRMKKKYSNTTDVVVDASKPTATPGRGTKRRSLENDNSNYTNEDSLSLRESLMKPEYPLMILLKLLLLQRDLVPAILQATKMEESHAFTLPVIYACFKDIFEFLIRHNRLFDTRDVPPQESLLAVVFPLCGRLGTLALSHLLCGVLERIQTLQRQRQQHAHAGRASSSSWSSEMEFVRRSCIRTLLQLLGSKHTLKEGLKHYEKLREDQFSAVLEGPLNLAMAKDICQHEIQVPASGFPNLARLLQGQEDDDDEIEEEVYVGHDDIAAGAFGGENGDVVPAAAAAAPIALVASDDEFHDAQEYLPAGDEAEDHGPYGAEKSHGEAQPAEMATVDATTSNVIQPARQERGDDEDGYDATAEESQDQEDDQDYDAGDGQGHDSDDDDDKPGQPPDAGGQKVEARSVAASQVVHPTPSSSIQQPALARTDDAVVGPDYGYDAEESQGQSDDSEKLRHAASLSQQTDNGYDGEESQVGHFDTEEGSVEHELAAGPEAATTLSEDREQHVTFAPVPRAAAQSEDDAGYLPDEHTEDEAAVRNERDGYQGGESSVHTEEEGDGSEAMRAEDEEDAKQRPSELDQQDDGVNESPIREPRRQPSHSLSDMSAADDERHPMGHQGEECRQESSDLDDDESGDDNRHFPPSPPSAAASGQRSTLHDFAAAAQDEFSPASGRVSDSSETESEDSSSSEAQESPSGRQEAEETSTQEKHGEREAALSVHSSPSQSTPDRKPAAEEASPSPYGEYGEDDAQYAASSAYSSPSRSSPDRKQPPMEMSPAMYDEDEDESAPGSPPSRGSPDRKQPAEETSPTHDVEGDGISTTYSSPSRTSPDGKQTALETSPSSHTKSDEEEAVEEGSASDNDVGMMDVDAEDGRLTDTGAGAQPSEQAVGETLEDLDAHDVDAKTVEGSGELAEIDSPSKASEMAETSDDGGPAGSETKADVKPASDAVDEPTESMPNSGDVVEDMDSDAKEATEPSGEKAQGLRDEISGVTGAETTVDAVPRQEVEMLDEQATSEDNVKPIEQECAEVAAQQADVDDGNEKEAVDAVDAGPLTEAATDALRVEEAGVEASGDQKQDASDSKAHIDLSIDGNGEAEEGKGDDGGGRKASAGEDAPEEETKSELATAVEEKETADNVDDSASGPEPVQEAGDDDKEAAMDAVEEEPTSPSKADAGQEASGDKKKDVAVEDEAERDDEADEKAGRAGEMRGLPANALEPIPEQEAVVDHEHGIHEISTSHPTPVDEDLGEHPSDQEPSGEAQEPKAADDDASAAHSVGTAGAGDDDNASRQSRTLRRSARKKAAPKTPSPARKHGDASSAVTRRTRSASKNADADSLASPTRSKTNSPQRRTRSTATSVAEDASSVASTTRSRASTPQRRKRSAATSAAADVSSVASHTRHTRSNAGSATIDEESIASHTRSRTGSVASHTRSKTKPPPSSSGKPPRAPPSSKKKKK